MTKVLDNVWELVTAFTANPRYVEISDISIEQFAPELEKLESKKDTSKPIGVETETDLVLFELIANSVNYCYWYGSPEIRPLNAGATKMYKLLEMSWSNDSVEEIVRKFIILLSLERFPMLEERIRHLKELVHHDAKRVAVALVDSKDKIEDCMDLVVSAYAGYAADMFLKRASLLFMQVNRRCDAFEEGVKALPIPADYQIPKMLEHMGILQYSKELKDMIQNDIVIPAGSRIECEIRASTILACSRLNDKSGKSPSEVDSWLWLNRKSCSNKFHLTVTTNY